MNNLNTSLPAISSSSAMESLDTTASSVSPSLPESHTAPVPTTSRFVAMEKHDVSSSSHKISFAMQDPGITSPLIPLLITIHSLPAEVIIMIQGYLDLIDSLNFRRTSKKIRQDLTPVIFSKIQVSYIPSSFQNLLNISISPSLRNHVRTLVYFGTVHEKIERSKWEENVVFTTNSNTRPPYPEIPSKHMFTEAKAHEYARAVSRWVNDCKPELFYTQPELDAGWEAYDRMLTGADALDYTYVDFSCIEASMKSFKNLHTLFLITNRGNLYEIDNGKTVRKPARRADLIGDGDNLLNVPAFLTEKLSTRQSSSILQAICAVLPKLRDLRCYEIPWSVIGSYFGRATTLGAFTHLKTLELAVTDLSNFITSETTDLGVTQNLLGQALQSVPGLEALLLQFERYNSPSEDETPPRHECVQILWSQVFGNNTWPHLKSLGIFVMDVEPTFVDFFSRHPKLKSISIGDPYLVVEEDDACLNEDDAWFKIFYRMKKILGGNNLETFDMGGKFEWGVESKYLLVEDGSDELTESTPGSAEWSIGDELIENWFKNNTGPPFSEKGELI